MEFLDFYKGFEGEPELKIIRKSNNVTIEILSMWIGFFDKLMVNIDNKNTDEKGNILDYYHTHTGWYEEKNWKLNNKKLLLNQINSIDSNNLDVRELEVKNSFVSILLNSIASSDEIYFIYE